ncbi:Fimbrial assembly protein PilN domain-containing protein [Desulfonema limicola]|uniref:Fimbrial assembly protein PilN domain-containing protein n=1 Tax=Desulfonema limicola TaxID=45656 RepID=A0A975BEG0_9BACT|nr:PilN domain-containing protein [Desulfonema limicola]QTA83649.1 Fimbrial assembly protein PilN domain-containing protein [Desulfonema limicola]
MIKINLLPYRAAGKKKTAHQQVIIFIIFVALTVTGLVWYNSKLNKDIAALQEQIAYTKKDIEHYNKIAKEVEELKNKLAILKRKLEIIEGLNANRLTAFTILDSMSELIVEKRMWFTSFEAQNAKIQKVAARRGKGKAAPPPEEESIKPPDINIKIKGTALDNKTVADFMTRMETSKLYTGVRLVTLRQEKFKQGGNRQDINLKGFELVCQKVFIDKPDEDKKPGTDKKEKK